MTIDAIGHGPCSRPNSGMSSSLEHRYSGSRCIALATHTPLTHEQDLYIGLQHTAEHGILVLGERRNCNPVVLAAEHHSPRGPLRSTGE